MRGICSRTACTTLRACDLGWSDGSASQQRQVILRYARSFRSQPLTTPRHAPSLPPQKPSSGSRASPTTPMLSAVGQQMRIFFTNDGSTQERSSISLSSRSAPVPARTAPRSRRRTLRTSMPATSGRGSPCSATDARNPLAQGSSRRSRSTRAPPAWRNAPSTPLSTARTS